MRTFQINDNEVTLRSPKDPLAKRNQSQSYGGSTTATPTAKTADKSGKKSKFDHMSDKKRDSIRQVLSHKYSQGKGTLTQGEKHWYGLREFNPTKFQSVRLSKPGDV